MEEKDLNYLDSVIKDNDRIINEENKKSDNYKYDIINRLPEDMNEILEIKKENKSFLKKMIFKIIKIFG